MKKLFFISILFLIGLNSIGQSTSNIYGNFNYKGTIYFTKPANNISEDSTLTLDYTTGKLKMVLKGANAITNVYRITGTDSVMKVINGTTSFAFSRSSNTIYQIQTAAGGIQTFTFTTIPASYADYVISVNGVIMRAGIDFTQLVNTITIPTITDGEYVEYRKIN